MKNQKGIASVSAIIIIIVIAAIAIGGVLAYQYWWAPEKEVEEKEEAEELYIRVISPNGEEEWVKGGTYTIKWANSSDIAKVDIYLQALDQHPEGMRPTTVKVVAENVTADGDYTWTSVEPDGFYFYIFIQTSPDGGPQVSDISDDYFSIVDEDETADWNVYRDATYGFEIKYPKEWKVSVSEPDSFSPKGDWGEQIGELAIFQSRLSGGSYCEFHLTTYSNPNNLSLQDFWRARLSEVFQFRNEENITFGVDRIQGVRFDMERTDQPMPNESFAVVAQKDGNIVELLWWGQDPLASNPDCLKVEKMLSTFRFID